MKNQIRILSAVAVALVAGQAEAVEIPGWERPILKATMEIKSAVGKFESVKEVELTMNRRDGSRDENPTSFYLTLDGQTIKYFVTEKVDAGCGSIAYKADTLLRGTDINTFVLIDHFTRMCDDLRPYRWETTVTHSNVMHHEQLSTMQIVGNPEPVYTIQMD